MKKKMISFAAYSMGLCLAAIGGYRTFSAEAQQSNSSLLLESVEALANNEQPSSKVWSCYSSIQVGDGIYDVVWLCGVPCTTYTGARGVGSMSLCFSN